MNHPVQHPPCVLDQIRKLSQEIVCFSVDVLGLVDVIVFAVLYDRGCCKWPYVVMVSRVRVPYLCGAAEVHEVLDVVDGKSALPSPCHYMVVRKLPLRLVWASAYIVYQLLVHVRVSLPISR